MPRLRAAMVGAQLVMAGCSAGPPSAPSAPPPPVAIAPGLDVSGVWSGDARVVSCTGSRYCFIGYLGRTFPFALHLAQQGLAIEGALGAVDVRGTTDGRGGLTLAGQTVLVAGGDAQSVQAVTEFTAEAAGSALRGRFTFETRYSATAAEAVANDVVTMHFEFDGFTRTAAVGVSGPAGRWQGSAVARSCTPPAWSRSSCYPYAAGEAAPFTLDLTADAALAGVLRIGSGSAPVSGTWDGATLRLSGEDRGSSGLTVLDWQAAPDRFARLQGTVRIRWAGGLSPAETLFELSGVVR
jgi:hypothetical protein